MSGKVRTGLDRLLEAGPELAGLRAGARVALLAHPASVDRRAHHAVERLVADPRLRLVRLLAPEHGLFGEAQDMEAVDHGADAVSGLPVFSLYGHDAASLRPRPEHLEGLDAVLCDLQDVGSRYYTFVYTIAFVMEACREAGIPVVVLDRPNPIGGLAVEGPVLEPELASFVGWYPLPVRHAMTVGELVRLFAAEFGARCDLRVVPMTGWRRAMHFGETGLPWVPPSPNMPSPATALVYPGGCLVEGTNLSEGRGTTVPFELVGAPWIRPRELTEALRAAAPPGAAFRAASFRPMFQKHRGRVCHGVQVIPAGREAFRPFATYLTLLREALRHDRDAFDWRREAYEFETERLAIDLLLGRRGLREMLEGRAPLDELEATWRPGLEQFRALRERFLLYRD